MKSYTLVLAGLAALAAAGPVVNTEARSANSKSIAARQNLQAVKQQACRDYPDSSSCDYQWSDCENYLKQVGRYNAHDMQHCMTENRPRVIEGHHKRDTDKWHVYTREWKNYCDGYKDLNVCHDQFHSCYRVLIIGAERTMDADLRTCMAQFLGRE